MKEDMGKRQPAQSTAPATAKPAKKKQLNPIIMISPSPTALVTMHNVKQLLEDSRCAESVQEALPRMTSADRIRWGSSDSSLPKRPGGKRPVPRRRTSPRT